MVCLKFLCICILVFLYCISWFSCVLQGLTLTTSPAPLAITTVMARCTVVRQATSAQGPPLVYILREHDLYKSQTSSPTGSRLTSNIKIIIKKNGEPNNFISRISKQCVQKSFTSQIMYSSETKEFCNFVPIL